MPDFIYKVVDRELWQQALKVGKFEGAEIDIKDGYIHLSSATQVVATVRKHFAGRDNLVLVAVDSDRLGDELRWEVSRGGDRFPHLYDSLNTDLVSATYELPLGADGCHDFSDINEIAGS